MKNICNGLITILFLVNILGCSTFNTFSTEDTNRPPKPKDFPIEVLKKEDISRKYKSIGYVNTRQPISDFFDSEDAIEELKFHARRLGGDAIVDVLHYPRRDDTVTVFDELKELKDDFQQMKKKSEITIDEQKRKESHYVEYWTAEVIVWE